MFYCMSVCLHICLSTCMLCAHIIQKVLDPLELELQMIVSQQMGIKPWYSGSALNY